MNPSDIDDIDEIVKKIKGDEQIIEVKPVPEVTDDTVNNYVYEKTTELVESSLAAINSLRSSVVQGQDPDEINALTALITATNKALDTLNKINLQNKQIKASAANKKLDLEARKEIASKRQAPTTNVLIATREEIMKNLNSSQRHLE